MSRWCVLAFGDFTRGAVPANEFWRALECGRHASAGQTACFTEAKPHHVRQRQWAGAKAVVAIAARTDFRDVSKRIRTFVAIQRGVGSRADANRVEHKDDS